MEEGTVVPRNPGSSGVVVVTQEALLVLFSFCLSTIPNWSPCQWFGSDSPWSVSELGPTLPLGPNEHLMGKFSARGATHKHVAMIWISRSLDILPSKVFTCAHALPEQNANLKTTSGRKTHGPATLKPQTFLTSLLVKGKRRENKTQKNAPANIGLSFRRDDRDLISQEAWRR